MPPKMTPSRLSILILAMSLTSAGQTGTTATPSPSAFPITSRISTNLPLRLLGPATDAPSDQSRGNDKLGAKPSIWKQQWDYKRPQRGFGETFKSPTFYPLFFGLLATNAIDIEATRASGCGEASEFGKKPSRLEQYGQDFAADFAVGAMAFFLHRAHIKVIPQAMLGYGIGLHIHGSVKGFHANCH